MAGTRRPDLALTAEREGFPVRLALSLDQANALLAVIAVYEEDHGPRGQTFAIRTKLELALLEVDRA